MRTINEKMFLRLAAQRDEAGLLKMGKLSRHLQNVVVDAKDVQRENDTGYKYSHEELRTDVERELWNAAIRAADYFGAPFDAVKAQKAIEKLAGDLIEEVRVIVGNQSGVGPYDVKVPGECPEEVMFEIEVSDD
jgi:hypothetical protein